MSISNQSAGFRPGVCLSTNRPINPFNGQVIYETDTGLLRIWNGSSWTSPKFDNPLGVVSGSTTRNIPFAMAVGSIYGGAVATTVSFPTGRFTVVPYLFTTNFDAPTYVVTLSNVTTNSFTWQNSVGGNSTLLWFAIQMTSSSAVG